MENSVIIFGVTMGGNAVTNIIFSGKVIKHTCLPTYHAVIQLSKKMVSCPCSLISVVLNPMNRIFIETAKHLQQTAL